MHIKTVKITNPNNVLVQVPGFVIENWNLKFDDGLEVHISEDEKSIIIKPRKGYINVRSRSTADRQG
jgi:hypothetical protein